MTSEPTKSRNEQLKIQELVSQVLSGRIRLPEFQRSFRWDQSDVLALFDSVLRGYPFGSLLLWKRSAPEAEVQIGALKVSAPQISDALWVVDGQQRITSLVNAVNPSASMADDRFRVVYSLDKKRFLGKSDNKTELAIPLPDLFDLSRAFAWLRDNPDAIDYAAEIQRLTGLLRDVEVSASVIEQADEQVLRDVFDRINSAGKRLRGSEIFDAIHSSTGVPSGQTDSIASIVDGIDRTTDFGRLDDAIVYQAILVRRHPDVTRDVHSEFSAERSALSPFPTESRSEAYERTEAALELVIKFMKDQAGIPHITFVPFRFHLLVLARFFAFYPDPTARNIELLVRWFWRSTAAASILGYTGSTANIRTLSAQVTQYDESGSVQRLLDATNPSVPVPAPSLAKFRTNHSAGKVVLAALWAKSPVDPSTGKPLSFGDLAAYLLGESSAAPVALELVPRRNVANSSASAANRTIAIVDRDEFLRRVNSNHFDSLLLNAQMVDLLNEGQYNEFLLKRAESMERYLRDFLDERTGAGFEITPPLSEFDFDD